MTGNMTLTRQGRKQLTIAERAKYGEPWRAGKSFGVIVTDAPGGAPGAEDREYYGGRAVAESMTPEERDRAIACVNFCAGVDLPEDADLGMLIDLLDFMEDLYKIALRGEDAFSSVENAAARVHVAEKLLKSMGRLA